MTQPVRSERSTMDAIATQSNINVRLLSQEEFDAIIQNHWKVHEKLNKKQAKLDPEDDHDNAGDLSCLRCYPVDSQQETSAEFDNFWNGWFRPLHSLRHYTQNTIDCFQAARAEENFETRVERLKLLLLTIRYKTWPFDGLPTVLTLLLDVWQKTFGFEQMDRLEPDGRSTPGDNSSIKPYEIALKNDDEESKDIDASEVLNIEENSPDKNNKNPTDNPEPEEEDSTDDEYDDDNIKSQNREKSPDTGNRLRPQNTFNTSFGNTFNTSFGNEPWYNSINTLSLRQSMKRPDQSTSSFLGAKRSLSPLYRNNSSTESPLINLNSPSTSTTVPSYVGTQTAPNIEKKSILKNSNTMSSFGRGINVTSTASNFGNFGNFGFTQNATNTTQH